MPLVLYDYCKSSDHDACNYAYRDYIDATCASDKKAINGMTNQMVETMKQRIAEYSHCFSHSGEDTNLHEPSSSLGTPNLRVSLYDDLSPLILLGLNDVMPLSSLEREIDPPYLYPPTLYLNLAHLRTPTRIS